VGHSLRASAGGQGVIDIWETSTLRKRHELKGNNSLISTVCFSPDGRRLVSASITADATETDIKVWDIGTGKELAHWNCLGGVAGLAFRRGGQQLVGVRTIWPETEEPVRIWDGRPRDAGRSP
jgi:WD40 repeat protein